MFCSFDEFGFHGRTKRACCVEMRARPSFVSVETCRCTECRFGAAKAAGVLSTVGGAAGATVRAGSVGGFDSTCEPPSAKICSSEAMPPPDDVGVPPDVSAMYRSEERRVGRGWT